MELHPDEKVIFEGHPSWRATLGYYLKGLAVAVLAAAITAVADEVQWALVVTVLAVVVGVVIVVGFVKRMTTVYTITTQRLRIKRGLVARSVQQTRIERVQNVNTDQSVLERILRVGTVDFDTAGADDSDFEFRGVNSPEEVVAAVDRAQKEAAREHQTRTEGL